MICNCTRRLIKERKFSDLMSQSSSSSSTFGVIPRSPTQYLKFQPTHSETAFSVSACLRPPSRFSSKNLPARHNRLSYALFRSPFRRLFEALIAKASRKIIPSASKTCQHFFPSILVQVCTPNKIDNFELYATLRNTMIVMMFFFSLSFE